MVLQYQLLIPVTSFLTDKRLVQIPTLHDSIKQLSVCVCGMVTSNQTTTAPLPEELWSRYGFRNKRRAYFPALTLVELVFTISSYCGGGSVSMWTSAWPTASSYDGGGSPAPPLTDASSEAA